MRSRLLVLAAAILSVSSFGVQQTQTKRNSYRLSTTRCHSAIDTSFMWNRGMSYGKGQFKFYPGFDKWMSVFPEEDRNAYPEVFNLPKGIYETILKKPLGIIFEEIEMGKGLYVQDIVDGSNAGFDRNVKRNDILVGITAVKVSKKVPNVALRFPCTGYPKPRLTHCYFADRWC